MTPDYERAAAAAAETLIKYKVDAAPVSPLRILRDYPGVLVLSYADMSADVQQDRQCVISAYGVRNQDAITAVVPNNGRPHYIVTYNQQLPFFLAQRALARQLGHIVLGHDGSRPEETRNAEAKCFAHHLLAPRAMIHALTAANVRITKEVFGTLTGCYDNCLSCIQKLPPVHVSADLNRLVRDQFMPYIFNFFEYQRYAANKDGSALAYLGQYMEGYEE